VGASVSLSSRTDDIRLHRYTDADRDGVFALLRAAFSEQYANHMRRMWAWKYDSHPLNREAERVRRAYREKTWPGIIRDYSKAQLDFWGVDLAKLDAASDDAPYVLLLKDGERVVAMEGSVPQAFLVNGTRRLVSVGCDFSVLPEYRGRSLSLRLASRMAMEHRMSFGWYTDTSKVVSDGWQKKFAPTLPKPNTKSGLPPGSGTMRVMPMVKPIDWFYMVHRTTGIRLPRRVADLAAAGANRIAGVLGRTDKPIDIEVFRLESCDGRSDDLWNRCASDHEVIGFRDSNYLNWRFNSRPDASYVFLAASRSDSHLVGYLVYRMVERDGGRWGYLVDFLCEGDPAMTFGVLATRAEELMVRDGAQSIVCFIAKAPYRKVLRQRGYYPAVIGERAYLGAGTKFADEHTTVFGELEKWFVTMADGDAEMIL
jgi:hypothetical protein